MKPLSPKLVYGTAWKKDETAALVGRALGAGFRAIDTANQAKHYNEPQVGDAVRLALSSGVKREELFLQTKFTPRDGQDHRLPYDERATVGEQVRQSFASSLDHLGTTYVDSYLLHGPYHYQGLGEEDWEVWRAMEVIQRSGAARQIGISNVSAEQVEALVAGAGIKPAVVQNRCYAERGWDAGVRAICRKHGIAYQGFSLLTANTPVLEDPRVLGIAERLGATPEQVIFRFAVQLGMVALTGTTDDAHMREDIAALGLTLSEAEMAIVEEVGVTLNE